MLISLAGHFQTKFTLGTEVGSLESMVGSLALLRRAMLLVAGVPVEHQVQVLNLLGHTSDGDKVQTYESLYNLVKLAVSPFLDASFLSHEPSGKESGEAKQGTLS